MAITEVDSNLHSDLLAKVTALAGSGEAIDPFCMPLGAQLIHSCQMQGDPILWLDSIRGTIRLVSSGEEHPDNLVFYAYWPEDAEGCLELDQRRQNLWLAQKGKFPVVLIIMIGSPWKYDLNNGELSTVIADPGVRRRVSSASVRQYENDK